MARVIDTSDPLAIKLLRDEHMKAPRHQHCDPLLWLYNGLDCCITSEVYRKLKSQLIQEYLPTYNFERALMGPVLDIMLTGILVDHRARLDLLNTYMQEVHRIQAILDDLASEVWGKGLNPNSPVQLKEFFFQALHVEEFRVIVGGQWKVSTNREALEKLQNKGLAAKIFSKLILDLRDAVKMVSVLKSGVDKDSRMRASFNIAGTETGRFSSSKNAFGSGMNLQNPTDRVRRMFVADRGMKLGYADLEQAESRAVAYIARDIAYIAACESGDLHTIVAAMVWPNLAWPPLIKQFAQSPDISLLDHPDWRTQLKAAKALADDHDNPFYRDWTYRDLAKRGGHGCLTPAHEVLTRKGWVPITEKPQEIMVFQNMRLDWGSVSHWEDKHWEGTLVSLRGTSISQDLTEDHRVVFVQDKKSTILREEPAIGFSDKGNIPLGFGYTGTKHVPEAKLVAAFQCDGHRKGKNRVEFHFHENRKIARLRKLCEELDLRVDQRGDKLVVHWTCPYPKQAGAYLFDWDAKSLRAYYNEHTQRAATARKEHLEWLQTIGRLVGFEGTKKYATKASIRVSHKTYSGRVVCPTVPGGAFLIRKDGKISITGNTNYRGTARTMAKHLKTTVEIMERFKQAYFAAFKGIPRWHQNVINQIQTTGVLTSLWGRRRKFYGRPDDDKTHREAIAFDPQSTVGDILNMAMLRVWHHATVLRDPALEGFQLLSQLHDAILFQYPEERESIIVPRVLELMRVGVPVDGQTLTIPVEVAVGWNWAKYNDKPRLHHPENLDGIKEWKGHDDRTRQYPWVSEQDAILDFPLLGVHS